MKPGTIPEYITTSQIHTGTLKQSQLSTHLSGKWCIHLMILSHNILKQKSLNTISKLHIQCPLLTNGWNIIPALFREARRSPMWCPTWVNQAELDCEGYVESRLCLLLMLVSVHSSILSKLLWEAGATMASCPAANTRDAQTERQPAAGGSSKRILWDWPCWENTVSRPIIMRRSIWRQQTGGPEFSTQIEH